MSDRTILADTRDMSREQADAVLAELASIDCRLAVLDAQHEDQVNNLKEAHDAACAGPRNRQKALAAKLTAYVLAHQDEFQKPRSRTTCFGKYGLQKATRLDVTDADACLAELEARGLTGCIRIKKSVDKTELRDVLSTSSIKLNTASVHAGDRAYYEVSKVLIRQAVTAATDLNED